MPATLFVVATPIGNLEDITVRALRILREVALIAAEDTRRTAHLLARHAISTPTTSLHAHNEGRKSAAILARLARGENVALVSDAGSPTVSDPGTHLIRQAIAAGVRVDPIPGPSAVLAALVASGMSTERFGFFGFPPIRSKDRNMWFRRLRLFDGTVVFFEAPHRLRRTLSELWSMMGDIPISIGRELTKVHGEFVRGPISVAMQRLVDPKGEITIVADVTDISQMTEIGRSNEETPSREPQATSPSRRRLLAQVAEYYGLSANDLYKAVEAARKSGK